MLLYILSKTFISPLNSILMLSKTTKTFLERIWIIIIKYLNACRTFAHRTLAQDWYFIDACKVNLCLFKTLFFLPRVPRSFWSCFFIVFFFLGRWSLLSCIFTCNSNFYDLKKLKTYNFFFQHLSKCTSQILIKKYNFTLFAANFAL